MRKLGPAGSEARASRYNLLLLCTNAVAPLRPPARVAGLVQASADFHHVPSAVRNVKQRPVYLDLPRIRLPLPGIISILHRVSGALLFLAGIPLLLYGVAGSLASPEAYAEMKTSFAHPVAKLVLVGIIWAYLHHFCAGIRYLLLDIHRGDRARARPPVERRACSSSALALTLILGARLW